MSENEKMKNITGDVMRRPIGKNDWGRTYQTSGIKALGGKSGFYAIREKSNGQIHVPSCYYSHISGETKRHWDSETNIIHSKGVWKITRFASDIDKMVKRLRKKNTDFELIAFSCKDGSKGIPYDKAYSSSQNIYYAGPSPLPREVANRIQEIVVLQSSLSPTANGGVIEEKNAIEMLVPVEV